MQDVSRLSNSVARPGLSLRRNFSWAFIGNIVYAACQWGILTVIAKLGTPVMVGQFALGFAIATPVILLTNLQLRTVQTTDAKDEFVFGDYLALRLLSVPLGLLAIIILALVTDYARDTAIVIVLIGIVKVLDAISDVFHGLLQRHGRMDCVATSLILNGVISIIAAGLLLWWTQSIVWATAGTVFGSAFSLFAYNLRSGAHLLQTLKQKGDAYISRLNLLRPRWSPNTFYRLICVSGPMSIVGLLLALHTNIPRYFIQHYLSERELGVYAAIAALAIAGQTVIGALGQAVVPRLAQHYADGSGTNFRRIIARQLALSTLLGATGILFALAIGKPFLMHLYGTEYAQHASVFIWLMIASAIVYIGNVFGIAVTAMREFKIQVPIHLVSLVIVLIGSYYLVSDYGITGAVWAMIIRTLFASSCFAVIMHMKFKQMPAAAHANSV